MPQRRCNTRYKQALPAGYYLVCEGYYLQCVPFEVKDAQVTTVNLKLIFGPMQAIVFDPGAGAGRLVTSFAVSHPPVPEAGADS